MPSRARKDNITSDQVKRSGSDPDEQNAIITIMEGTSGHTGEEFFRLLVKKLSLVLGTSGAWVTELIEKENRLKAFAFWLNGGWVENYEYNIQGTPCEPVIRNSCRVHLPDKVVELYPEDPDLRECKAVSYLGEPLLDSSGKVIGHLAILDTKPMPEDPTKLAIFRIFAARASAELTRMNAEKQVREREEKLGRLVNSAMDGIVEFDEELNITQLNPAAIKMLSSSSGSDRSNTVTDFVSEDERAKLRILAKRLISYPDGEKFLWIPGGLGMISAKGSELKTEATLSLSEMHGRYYFTLIFRNINDRIEAEEKINALTYETQYLKEELNTAGNFGDIKGNSAALLSVINGVKQVSSTDATVLINGETGTGKELVARAIHAESNRKDKPLIKVNCAAIPANLIESELFGHEKGAFTGATSKREGRFRLADGGTIFLDEVGELPTELQSKLLRVLQEGEFEPVGSSRTIKVNTRVIAATNRDLQKEVREGRFREDLYYRLNVFPLKVPPLRERGEDILILATDFADKYAKRMGKKIGPFTEGMKKRLMAYDWPGNVRELQNVIERAVITSGSGEFNLDSSLPPTNTKKLTVRQEEQTTARKIRTVEEMQELERENIILALEQTDWRVSGKNGAAALLGMPPTTLSSRIRALNITKED